MTRKVNKVIFLVMFFIFVFVLLTVKFGFQAQADDKEAGKYVKTYTSVQTQDGDTLTAIASKHYDAGHYSNLQDYVDEICKLNRIQEDDIHAGYYLSIPYYMETVPAA